MTGTVARQTIALAPTHDRTDVGRTVAAVLIVTCLSSGPYVALSRWVARVPLTLDSWPYRATYGGAAALGSALLIADVVVPGIRRRHRPRPLASVGRALGAALAVWAVLSLVWTDSPERTREQAVLMALVMAAAVWLGTALTFRQQVLALFIGLQGLTLVSVAAALTLPSARFDSDDSWMGVFGNPNTLSPIAGIAVVAAVGLLTISTIEWLPAFVAACVIVDLLAVWKADSATGWIALAGGAIAAGAVIVVRRIVAAGVAIGRVRAVGLTVVAGVVGTLPWTMRIASGVVGKDRTLTGRTVIWDFVLDEMTGHWVAGYGFDSFWDDPANAAALSLRRDFASTPDASHSTFFEVLVYLGVVGLILVVALVALSIGVTWWRTLGAPGPATAWVAAVTTFALIENVTESMIRYHSIFWVLLVAPAFAVRADAQRRGRSPA